MSGAVSHEERLARAALTGVIEPGDELMGRQLARLGAEPVWRALERDEPLPEVPAGRWAGLRLRAERATPGPDLEEMARCGGRLVCPGDWEWPGQLDDLGEARPVGLWVRGGCSLRFVALRSVSLVGARACTDYGGHMAAELGAALAERGWTVISGAAYGIDGAAHRGALAVAGPTGAVTSSVFRGVRHALADDLNAPMALQALRRWSVATNEGADRSEPGAGEVVRRLVGARLGVLL